MSKLPPLANGTSLHAAALALPVLLGTWSTCKGEIGESSAVLRERTGISGS